MKILVLSNLYPPDVIGGYELGCRQMVDALRRRGHEARVLTGAPRTPAPAEEHVRRGLELTDVWSHYLFERRLPANSHLWQAASHRVSAFNVHALLDEVDRFRPDVVYSWMLVGIGGLGLMAALQHVGLPWVWHLMDDVPVLLCRSAGEVVTAFVRQYNRILAGTYILCSRQLGDEIAGAGIKLGDRVEIIPNWVEGPIEARAASSTETGVLRIMTAAGWVDRRGDKGLNLLIEAARRLLDRRRDGFHIDIYGQVVDASIPELVRELGVERVVTLQGPKRQAELGPIAAAHDLFAFPTRPREPFGFAPLEAAARGCVPLISQVCGLAEWLVHGVHVLKAPRRAESFAGVIEAILDREIDLEGLRRRCAGAARRDFHVDAIAPRVEQLLEDAARRPRGAAGSAADAYRMARLAERLTEVLIQEPLCV